MKVLTRLLVVASLLLLTSAAAAEGWKHYESKTYGFSMLIPEGTSVEEKEWSGGWAGLYAKHEGVRLYGIAKLGVKATDEEIEKFCVQTIGIPEDGWTQVDSGKDKNGWARYRTFKATKGSKLVFGGYGVGPKGTYVLYLETTVADYKEYKADYDKWYASIELE